MKIIIILCFSAFIFFTGAFEGKIRGGWKIRPGHRKCLISFRHKNKHRCSGVLISENHVLTAAHCLNEFFTEKLVPNFKEYSIVVGLIDSLMNDGQNHSIEEVRAHRTYNPRNPNPSYDIGLIMLMENVVESDSAGWIDMIKNEPKIGTIAEVLGWGIHIEKQTCKNSITIKKIEVELRPNVECAFTKESVICTANTLSDDFFDQEDIGAPMIQNMNIIGILTTRLTRNRTIFSCLYNAAWRIANIRETRQTAPRLTAPRKRARYEQYLEQMTAEEHFRSFF